MAWEFVIVSTFDKLWDNMGLSDEDLREFQNMLIKNPFAGTIIQKTGGARKIRFALPGKGKSSGLRAIYFEVIHFRKIYLIICYPKDKQEDLTSEQKKQVKKIIETVKGV